MIFKDHHHILSGIYQYHTQGLPFQSWTHSQRSAFGKNNEFQGSPPHPFEHSPNAKLAFTTLNTFTRTAFGKKNGFQGSPPRPYGHSQWNFSMFVKVQNWFKYVVGEKLQANLAAEFLLKVMVVLLWQNHNKESPHLEVSTWGSSTSLSSRTTTCFSRGGMFYFHETIHFYIYLIIESEF